MGKTPDPGSSTERAVPRAPAVFIGHGSPMMAITENDYTRTLRRYSDGIARPTGIVVVSAHWQEPGPPRITSMLQPELIYDFFGFPDELYAITYPCPGSPPIAAMVAEALAEQGIPSLIDRKRGLDHGTWIPMRIAYPAADIPVLQLSLPEDASPRELLKMGNALSPLRDRGILLVGSGNLVHNLRQIAADPRRVDSWAAEFDGWIKERLARLGKNDLEELLDYRRKAPNATKAAPTTDHFDPLFVVLGLLRDGEKVESIYEGIDHGSISMRSFALTA